MKQKSQTGKKEQEILELLTGVEMTAKQIAEETGIPLTGTWGGVYEILHRLERKELLQSNGRPMKFTAVE